MFFQDRIKSIGEKDKVLEIGPGATPHPRADVFLEKIFETDEELIAQSGHVGKIETDKKIVFYKGDRFPFEDNEFDYIICSHVLEHVESVPEFLKEIERVGKKGYLEFPTIYYDYLLDIEEHLNMLLYKNEEILWCKKSDTPIPSFKNFTLFFKAVQANGYRFQASLNQYWHHGFEWEGKINCRKVDDWRDLMLNAEEISSLIKPPEEQYRHQIRGVGFTLRHLLKEISFKFTGKKNGA